MFVELLLLNTSLCWCPTRRLMPISPPRIWTSAIRYVSGSEMSIPSKDKARARLPKRVPGKGQKFTLTMVNPLELRGEIAIESATSVFILFFVLCWSCRARIVVLSRHEKPRTRVPSPAQTTDSHMKHKIQRNTSHNEISSIKFDKSFCTVNIQWLGLLSQASPSIYH